MDADPDMGVATLYPAQSENIFIAKYNNTLTNVTDLFSSVNSDLLIYPNPASDFVNAAIQNPSTVVLSLQITDAIGKVLFNDDNSNANKKINISTFNPGIYTLTVKTDSSIISKLFIKQ
ncbi:MAG: T9SS type A sorting domain-containing protein [Bacteroidetes bacterium]|nr:T9SS type A sorting domain-containing protein [Bacteroidota bacterium]